MIKRVMVGSGVGLLLMGILFGRDAVSYVSTSAGWVKQSVTDSVPVEFQIERARKMIDDLEPEVRRNKHLIVKEEVALERLSEQVAGLDRRQVQDKGNLSEAQAALVVEMARQQSLLFGASEDYLVTREFREISTREQRIGLLDCLFAVSAADRSISALEGRVLMQIADELKLDRREYTNLRSAYREYLSVLQKPEDAQD